MQIEQGSDSFPTCAYTGKRLPVSSMVRIGEHWVAEDHKDACVQFLQQGGALPVFHVEHVKDAPPPRLIAVWAEAWRLFARAFPVMLVLHGMVWLPGNLLSSWLAYDVVELEIVSPLAMARGRILLDAVLFLTAGVFGHACCLYAMGAVWRGRRSGIKETAIAGIRFWPRVFLITVVWGLATGVVIALLSSGGIDAWTIFFANLSWTLAGVILLLIPGSIIMARLSFASCYAVDECRPFTASLAGSLRLSQGHTGRIIAFELLSMIVADIPVEGLAWLTSDFREIWDHWALDGVLNWLGDVPTMFVLAVTYVLWRSFQLQAGRMTAEASTDGK